MIRYTAEDDPPEGLISTLGGYMRVGAGYILAAAACGIEKEVAETWLEKANEAGRQRTEGPFLDLFNALRQATAYAEVLALQRLSAEGGASGAKWLLERINPEKYNANAKKERPKKPDEVRQQLKEVDIFDDFGPLDDITDDYGAADDS